MKKIIIAFVFCTLIGMSAGYVGGRIFLPGDQEESGRSDENKSGRFMAANHRHKSSSDRFHSFLVSGNELLDLRVRIQQGKMSPEELKAVYHHLMETDSDGDSIFQFYDKERAHLLMELGSEWGLLAPRQALAELEKDHYKKGLPIRQLLAAFILHSWAERDPEAVASYYMQNREKLAGNQTSVYLYKWAETDPEAAWRNLSSLSDFEKNNGIQSFFSAVFDFHPGKAGELMSKLDDNQWERDRFMSFAMNKWSQTDREGMDKWMAGLSSEQQNKLKPFIAMIAVEKNPEEGGMTFSGLSPEDQKRALNSMKENLNGMETREKIDWVMKYASEDIAIDWTPGYIKSYARESPVDMHEWLRELSEGKLREKALTEYSLLDGLKVVSYPSRLDLMKTLPDDRTRDNAIDNILRRWIGDDPEESKKWIESSSLNEDTKAKFFSYLQMNKELKEESLYKQ